MFITKMQKEPTPERVYALCKFAQENRMSKEELRGYLEPTYLNANPDLFDRVFSAAQELELIAISDGAVIYLAPAEGLVSFSSFRRLAAKRVFSKEDSVFFRFTSWYLSMNEDIFRYDRQGRRPSELPSGLSNVNPDDVLGWRFWAAFLGLGLLHDSFLIPNAAVRLRDALDADTSLLRNEYVEFSVFVQWLRRSCPETIGKSASDRRLCLGLSQGLRTLTVQNRLELRYTPDAGNKWNMYQMEVPGLPSSEVSEILVKG